MNCPGHRRFSSGRLLGICVACDLQQDSDEDPPMCVTLEAGRYVCSQRVYTAPVDRFGSHRFAVPVVAA